MSEFKVIGGTISFEAGGNGPFGSFDETVLISLKVEDKNGDLRSIDLGYSVSAHVYQTVVDCLTWKEQDEAAKAAAKKAAHDYIFGEDSK